ncbi:unnamed protein product [Pleuronectes platessa]|uniref:Uncharacterized protein n=1 Tax=Pleuronectes platessa TaxID=8262 RepID=A0A9N7VX98_PLEPL|nr:unnamed protein product [Pleuronectes platessa]
MTKNWTKLVSASIELPVWPPARTAAVGSVVQSQHCLVWQRVRISAVHSEHVKQQYWANGFPVWLVGCFPIDRRVAQVLPFTTLGADNAGKGEKTVPRFTCHFGSCSKRLLLI